MVDRATEISDVLRTVHLSTLENLYPGEDPISTQSEFLSLGSQKTSCDAHSCASVVVSPPALSNEDPSSSSFTLSSEALSEIVAGLNTGFERETTELLGIQTVAWGTNPWEWPSGPWSLDDGITFPSMVNASVFSISLTTTGSEIEVANLSSPVVMALPVSTRQAPETADNNLTIEGKCNEQSSLNFTVRCETTGEDYEVVCQTRDHVWHLNCRVEYAPAASCLYFNGITWSSDEITVRNRSDSEVQCSSTHLSSYVGIVGQSATSAGTVMSTYGSLSRDDFERSAGLLCLIIASYVLTLTLAVRSHRSMGRARVARAVGIWRSSEFQESLVRISERDSEQLAATMADEARQRAKRIEQSTALTMKRVRDSSMRMSLKDYVRLYLRALVQRNGLLAFLLGEESSYEHAPALLMELLTMLCGVAAIYVRTRSLFDLLSSLALRS